MVIQTSIKLRPLWMPRRSCPIPPSCLRCHPRRDCLLPKSQIFIKLKHRRYCIQLITLSYSHLASYFVSLWSDEWWSSKFIWIIRDDRAAIARRRLPMHNNVVIKGKVRPGWNESAHFRLRVDSQVEIDMQMLTPAAPHITTLMFSFPHLPDCISVCAARR